VKVLGLSLAALARSTLSRECWELIVVDDGSTDASALVAARFADIVIRLPGKPRGPAYARNRGFEASRGDVVVFVDADVCVHPETLGRFVALFDSRPDVSAIFGSYDSSPSHPGVISEFRNLLHHHVHQRGAGPAETFWTGLGAIRREVFADLGGFDEARYRHASIEDIELGVRLRRRGHRILLDPTIQGTHLKAWTLGSMVRTDFARRGVPWVALQVRDRRASASLNLGWRHRVSALACVVALAAVSRRRLAPAAAAMGAFVGLNLAFYRLLWRRGGGLGAALGVGLHGLHHLVGVAAVPAGLLDAVARPGGSMSPWRPR
jgi:glycosyltransferase involved in cell wall biosynthesis